MLDGQKVGGPITHQLLFPPPVATGAQYTQIQVPVPGYPGHAYPYPYIPDVPYPGNPGTRYPGTGYAANLMWWYTGYLEVLYIIPVLMNVHLLHVIHVCTGSRIQ